MSVQADIAIVALTFVLAWLSYHMVEQPARRVRMSAARVALLQFAVPSALAAVLALAAMLADGYGLRLGNAAYKSQLSAYRDSTRPAYDFDYVCQRQRVSEGDLRERRCIGGAPGAAPAAILWGDSNAAHYVGVLGAIARDAGFSFRNIAVGACPPLRADPAPYVTADRLADCRRSAAPLANAVDQFKVVIVSASWTTYADKSPAFLDAFFGEMRTLAAGGHKVILLGKAPVFSGYDRRCREKALSFPLMQCSAVPVPEDAAVAEANARLQQFARQTPNVSYVDFGRALCQEGRCSAFDAQGEALYFDKGHLSMPASWKLGESIVAQHGVPDVFRHL